MNAFLARLLVLAAVVVAVALMVDSWPDIWHEVDGVLCAWADEARRATYMALREGEGVSAATMKRLEKAISRVKFWTRVERALGVIERRATEVRDLFWSTRK